MQINLDKTEMTQILFTQLKSAHSPNSQSIQEPNWLSGFCITESLTSNGSSTNRMATLKVCLLTLKYYTLMFYVGKNIATLKQALKESLKKILSIIL